MKPLSEKKWRAFDIHYVFPDVKRGKRLKTEDHVCGNMAYISSSAANNGLDNFIGNEDGVRMFENCITLTNSGSVGTAFYHPYRFVASDHVTKLKNEAFNKYIYLFIATVANRLSEKYSFNREINDKRLQREKIMLPIDENRQPDYAYMDAYMRAVEKRLLERYKSYLTHVLDSELMGGGEIKDVRWKAFCIDEICTINPGVRLVSRHMTEGQRPFIGATDSNNGITNFVNNTNASLDSNVLGVNYNGSVVENFYHPYEAIFSDDVKRVKFKQHEGNKYVYLFLKAAILKQKSKYRYGYKFNGERMNRQKIVLPVTQEDNLNFQFMERYMRHQEAILIQRYVNKRLALIS